MLVCRSVGRSGDTFEYLGMLEYIGVYLVYWGVLGYIGYIGVYWGILGYIEVY